MAFSGVKTRPNWQKLPPFPLMKGRGLIPAEVYIYTIYYVWESERDKEGGTAASSPHQIVWGLTLHGGLEGARLKPFPCLLPWDVQIRGQT